MQHRGRGRGGRHADRGERIERTYQASIIVIRVAVDADDIKPGAFAEYVAAFTPDEEELNAAKDALGSIGAEANKVGKTKKYLDFRSTIDIYADLRYAVRKVSGERNVSNAFLKYYELASAFLADIVGRAPAGRAWRSFFNAELPGSSMVAFNHYMRTVWPEMGYDWFACSLWSNDLVEGSYGLGDTYGYVKSNRDKWLMTDTNNGDMTSVENILDVAARIGPKSPVGGVDIYSHDAGIDVSGAESGEERYDIQEDSNMWLHLGCALAGFLTLRVGPDTLFIAKQYTCFRTFTWNLIMLYSSLFDKFYLTKPLTSRPTNSEIYLVGVGFRGIQPETVQFIIDRMRTRNSAPFIPEIIAMRMPALGSIQRFAGIVYGQQRDMLLQIVHLQKVYTAEQIIAGTRGLKHHLIERWLKNHPVKPISAADRVPSG